MTKQQMARQIKVLEQRIEDLEWEVQSATGRILPVGWVSHPVGDTSVPGQTTTDAKRPCYLDPSGQLVALGER